ncbi:hypothetical protein CR513_60545, partial [Mucuna pruriens]
MYLFLLRSKDEALDAFKAFKAKVEKQYGKQIKIMIFDRGGECYGRYTENGQAPGPFVEFLQEHEIITSTLCLVLHIRMKPSSRHICIWGSPSKVRIYNPQEKKQDLRTISGYFIGYAGKSKGYRFYYPTHNTRIVDLRNAKFLENDFISRSGQFQNIVNKKDHYKA